jgi:hypothetical protein
MSEPPKADPTEGQPPATTEPAKEQAPTRSTPAQRAQVKREQKLADMQEEIDDGRMTVRQLTPEEMEEHAKRRAEVQAERAARRKR